MRRTSYGAVRTHCLIAVSGRTWSHRWRVASHILLAEALLPEVQAERAGA